MHLGALFHLNFSSADGVEPFSHSFADGVEPFSPHLEESTILEHFISVVSSCCPCLRGSRSFSLKLSYSGMRQQCGRAMNRSST
jgi:hypothetical protein